MNSGWFDCTKPSLSTSLQGKQGMQGSALVRGGSSTLNLIEPSRTTSLQRRFEKVRGGSRGLNHSETVYRYPTHLVPTVKMRFEKVRYSRTTPNSRQRLLHM